MTSYAVGSLAVGAIDWPQDWLACVDGWLTPSDARPDFVVRHAGAGLPAEAFDGVSSEAPLLSRVDESRWRFHARGAIDADIDTVAGTVTARTTPDATAGVSLGNLLRGLVATMLPIERDGLMLHASAGVLDGAGVVFTGISTAGKTTLALDFKKTRYVTDDVALVSNVSTTPTLIPSPFFGAAGVQGKAPAAPLAAIGVLVEKVVGADGRSSVEVMSRAAGAAALLRHVARFAVDRALSEALLDRTAELARRVPIVAVRRSLNDASDDVVRRVLEVAGC